MYKLSAALALTGLVGVAFTSGHDSKPMAVHSDTQLAIAPSARVPESAEHVRHLHSRKKLEPASQAETPPRQVQSASNIDAAPTGEIKHTRKKPKSVSRKPQREMANREPISQPTPADETQYQKPHGFFEALFSGE